MKITKLGILNGDRFAVGGKDVPPVARIVSTLEMTDDSVILQFPLIIGVGAAAREVLLDVPFSSSVLSDQLTEPSNINPAGGFTFDAGKYVAGFMYKDQVFVAIADYLADDSEEMAVLLIKRQVLAEDNKIKRLRQEVDALERVIEQVEGPKREPIPEAVKLVVWARDGGKCVKCGSDRDLHFDHIIPVSKGGGNSEANIQILCERCNLQKGSKIAF